MFGSKYAVGTGADLLYEASGASHDWAKGAINTPYSFLVELRPQNTLFNSGFLLPESEILATGQETWAALKVVADEVLEKYGRPNGRKLVKTPLPRKSTTATMTTTTATTTTIASTSPSTSTESVITRRNLVTSRRTFAPISRVKTTTLLPTISPSTTPSYTSRAFPEVLSTWPLTSPAPPTFAPRTTGAVVSGSSARPAVAETTSTAQPNTQQQRVIKCRDYGSYCRWWRIHGLCDKQRVLQLCSLSCLPECQI